MGWGEGDRRRGAAGRLVAGQREQASVDRVQENTHAVRFSDTVSVCIQTKPSRKRTTRETMAVSALLSTACSGGTTS